MQKLSCPLSCNSSKHIPIIMNKFLFEFHFIIFRCASFLLKALKSFFLFVLDRDFSSTLVIIGLFSILPYIFLDLQAGLYVSVILLNIYLILGMYFLAIIIRDYGLQIDVELSVDIGGVLSAITWVFITLICLITFPD